MLNIPIPLEIASFLSVPFPHRVLHASLGLPLTHNPPRSLALGQRSPGDGEAFLTPSEMDSDLAMALRMSEEENRERQLEIEREEKLLQEILELSLQEK